MNRMTRAVAIGAITAAAGIGVGTLGAGVAFAHEASASATCEGGVQWAATNYADANHTVTVWIDDIDGTPEPGYPQTFNQNGSGTAPNPDMTVGHDWKVFVDQFGDTQYDRTFTGHIDACSVTPVTPTYVESQECGTLDTLTAAPDGNHITYSPAYPTVVPLDPGPNPNVITATADPGWSLTTGNPTFFSQTGSKIEVCTLDVMFGDPTCVDNTYTVFIPTPSRGMQYIQTGVAGSGALVAVDAVITDPDLYTFQIGVTTHWEHQFPVAPTNCETPVQPTQPATTTTTTTTVSGVSPATPTTPAPQVAPPVVTAPPAPIAGLPETGSNNTVTALLGGLALIAGTALLAGVRRRAATRIHHGK